MTITTRATAGVKVVYGLASDTKPTTDMPTGSLFYETDTGARYLYNGATWAETRMRSVVFVSGDPS